MLMSNRPIFFDSQTKQALVKLASRIDDLVRGIERASASAEDSAKTLARLTWVLIALTAAIVLLTLWLVVAGD